VFIGEKAGASIGAIIGFVLIGAVMAFAVFFGYRSAIMLFDSIIFLQIMICRYWKRRGSLKTTGLERNGSPVYFEASESTSSDALNKGVRHYLALYCDTLA